MLRLYHYLLVCLYVCNLSHSSEAFKMKLHKIYLKLFLILWNNRPTVKIISIGTDRPEQTVQTKIRLLLKGAV